MKAREVKQITFKGKKYLAVLIDNYYYEVDNNSYLTYKKICYSKEEIVITDNGELN